MLLRSLIDKHIGGIGQGSKGGFGVEEKGAFRSQTVWIPGPAKKELIRIRSQVKIHMIQGMPQVAK